MINLDLRRPPTPIQALIELACEYGLFIVVAGLLYYKFAWFAALVATDTAGPVTWSQINSPVIPEKIYISFALLSLSFTLLLRGWTRLWALGGVNFFLSLLMVADLICYRGTRSFLSPLLLQAPPLSDTTPWWSWLRPADLLFFLDVLCLGMVAWRWRLIGGVRRHLLLFLLTMTIPLGYLGHVHYLADVQKEGYPISPLFQKSWAPHQNMLYLTPLGYHLLDLHDYWRDYPTPTVSASERSAIANWYQAKQESLPANHYQGLLRGKNLILLQVESLEQFVINREIQGQAITPTLNSLLAHSLYFPNFYEQVHFGTSSDADFLANTSLYPVREGSTFLRFPNNRYRSLPEILGSQGYSTLAIHPDHGIRWNWLHALTAIGFDRQIDSTRLRLDETIGLGLSDGSFLRQVVPLIGELKQPFYSFMVTLTNHGPFDLPARYRQLQLDPSLDATKLGGYFQSVRYTDQQIGAFLERLDQKGLLDNTVVVIYGDHGGIHKFYNGEVEQLPNQETWWRAEENNWRIPLLIYAKGLTGEQIETIGGQVDILPTVSALLGVGPSLYEGTAMGRNLLNTAKSFAVLADGTVVGEAISPEEQAQAAAGLDLADKMIRSNYFATTR